MILVLDSVHVAGAQPLHLNLIVIAIAQLKLVSRVKLISLSHLHGEDSP